MRGHPTSILDVRVIQKPPQPNSKIEIQGDMTVLGAEHLRQSFRLQDYLVTYCTVSKYHLDETAQVRCRSI